MCQIAGFDVMQSQHYLTYQDPPARVGFKRKLIERDPITHSQGNNA
jgi:hypothetical protein